jgi:LEA14-like dessication related protein
MFLSRRRLVLIGTVAIIGGVIILLPLILTITLPDLNKVSITTNKIEFKGLIEKNNTVLLNLFFNINNPTSQALTTSKIDYKLFANGQSLGDHTIQYLDTPVNGRPQLLANRDATIQQEIKVPITDEKLVTDLRNNNNTLQNIDWKVQGSAIIESGFSSAIKNFTTSW